MICPTCGGCGVIEKDIICPSCNLSGSIEDSPDTTEEAKAEGE